MWEMPNGYKNTKRFIHSHTQPTSHIPTNLAVKRKRYQNSLSFWEDRRGSRGNLGRYHTCCRGKLGRISMPQQTLLVWKEEHHYSCCRLYQTGFWWHPVEARLVKIGEIFWFWPLISSKIINYSTCTYKIVIQCLGTWQDGTLTIGHSNMYVRTYISTQGQTLYTQPYPVLQVLDKLRKSWIFHFLLPFLGEKVAKQP